MEIWAFGSSQYKPFRKVLHPIVHLHFHKPTLSSSSTSITSAEDQQHISNTIHQSFRLRNWKSALDGLYRLALSSEVPKLGALQRWVRDCNVAYEETGSVVDGGYTNIYLALLDAVMRVMIKRQSNPFSSSNTNVYSECTSL